MQSPSRLKPAMSPATPPQSVSISEVAREAGVSIATVSRVINGVANKAAPDTVARVRAVIATMGYRPSSAGRVLRSGQSRLVAVLASNMGNPTMPAIAAATEVALRRAGFVMVLCDTHDRPDLQDEYLREMRAQSARALVLLGAVDSPVLRDLAVAGEPVIYVNRRSPVEGTKAPYVGIDNRAAGLDVASWMARQSLTSVAMIHGALTSSATLDRVQGFQEGLLSHAIALPKRSVLTVNGQEHLEIGRLSMLRLLAQKSLPQAVFCTSDLIAYGAHRVTLESGQPRANDIVFVGFDDSPINPWVAPWLSTVRVPYAQFGDAIVQALQSPTRLEIILRHELIIRAVMAGVGASHS
jgi:LacI family transcriptional regulator